MDDTEILVPVELQFGRAKPVTSWIRASSEGEKFTLKVRQAPVKVLFDPGDAVLAEKK
jgi:hypothetical protein